MNEKAVVSLEKELNDTVKQLVEEAQVYANYAGRRRTIKRADVALAGTRGRKGRGGGTCQSRRKGTVPARLHAEEQAGQGGGEAPGDRAAERLIILL